MFGFKKKKKKNDIDKFANDLIPIATDMNIALPFMGDEDVKEMVKRSLSDFLEKNPEEAHYKPSDHYINRLVGATAEIAQNPQTSYGSSLEVYENMMRCINENPKYLTPTSHAIMGNYRRLLDDIKATRNSGEFNLF